jgi:signal transduction histidine kinase
MSGDLDQAGFAPAGFAEYLTARTKWIALAAFAAVTAVGVLQLKPSALAAAVAALVAVGAAGLLVQQRRPQLLYAAVATAGIAVLADGLSSNVGWIAVCLIAAWCVLTGSRVEGLAYWAGAMILFTVEWLVVKPDPGWGAWLAGVTLTVAFGLLVRHERDLLRQLRQAQAVLAEQARTQERNRIARELHDVIGHTLTVSLLHVQSARLAVEHDPADAARPGRSRTARPRVPGRGTHHGRDAPPGRPH